RTQNAAADAPVAPPWVALAIFSVVNAIAGILILIFLGHSTSLVTGFTASLVFLGISYLGWLAAGIGLWKKDLAGLSFLGVASGSSAALCILMRMLLSCRAAHGFSSEAFRVAWDPFELSRLWVSLAQWLTFLSFSYSAISALLFFRFRRVWIAPRPYFLASTLRHALLPSGTMLRVLLWWLTINSLGVSLSVLLADFGRPAQMHLYGYAVLALVLAGLGTLQVLASCRVISLVKVRNRVVLIALGSIIGILTAIGVMILGMTFLWVYAALGFWSWGLTGMVFGAVAGHSQWRSLLPQHCSSV